jgi:hypothetical protein
MDIAERYVENLRDQERYAMLGRACESNGLAWFDERGQMLFQPPAEVIAEQAFNDGYGRAMSKGAEEIAAARGLALAVKPFIEAAAGTSDFWSDKRRMASLSYSELTVKNLRDLARHVAHYLATSKDKEA